MSLRRFLRTHGSVSDLPQAVLATSFGRIAVQGDRESARSLARAVLGQFAAFHTPGDVAIAVCAAPENLPHWEWVKWLPHAYAPDETDAVGRPG